MASTVLVVHYAEIALKGGNRPWFEGLLREDLVARLKPFPGTKVRRERGRLVVTLGSDSEADAVRAADLVARVPGVAWFAIARAVERDIAVLESEVAARSRSGAGSFAVDARRADKSYPLDSMEVNRRVGAAVVAATGRKVDLTAPDQVYGIEIAKDRAFVFDARRRGAGGLPVGSAGRVVALISGGIDSPVAAWRMITRGCRVQGVHFLNDAVDTAGVREKIDLLGAALATWQGRLSIRVVPFGALQRAIVAAVPADHRMLVYRRTMLRLADRVRALIGAKALVTGDSVGQVASQTLDNLRCVYSAVPGPILSPLCGEGKDAIVAEARRIGTFEPSILPHDDCCSFLVDPHPVTKARLRDVEAMEHAVAWGTLADEALEKAETLSFPAE
ncbi:MAG TPA: tRNA uracil 4-sulfurtransferase ThiI [Planctomycetota bacterium]|nr:tRNA uracil 4-sulfurtransferase ThiI [Planctomycetota bacterium]